MEIYESCHECGGVRWDSPLMKERYECTCLRCEHCGGVYGNSIESEEWNRIQYEHHRKECPE